MFLGFVGILIKNIGNRFILCYTMLRQRPKEFLGGVVIIGLFFIISYNI